MERVLESPLLHRMGLCVSAMVNRRPRFRQLDWMDDYRSRIAIIGYEAELLRDYETARARGYVCPGMTAARRTRQCRMADLPPRHLNRLMFPDVDELTFHTLNNRPIRDVVASL